MKKVLIIAPGDLPLPATKGGAVETGIDQILLENEKNKDIIIDVISQYDKNAADISKKFKNSNFEYYIPSKYDGILKIVIKLFNKFFKYINIKISINIRPLFLHFILKKIKNRKYDAILIKNTLSYVIPIRKKTDSNIYLQLHNDFLNSDTPKADKITKACTKIIANSNYIKKRILSIKSISPDDVFINMNCLDDYSFRQASDSKRCELFKKHGINKKCKIILFSGRIVKEKGIKELLNAVSEIKINEDWRLLIAGNKWFSSNIKDKYMKELNNIALKCKEKIIFLGYIPHNEISFYNSIADAVVIPSIWDEPAGRVALEAEAVGTPIIISDSGGLPEYAHPKFSIIVKRNENFIYNLRKAIESVLIDNKSKNGLKMKGLITYAKQYNARRYYYEIMKYMNIIEGNSK